MIKKFNTGTLLPKIPKMKLIFYNNIYKFTKKLPISQQSSKILYIYINLYITKHIINNLYAYIYIFGIIDFYCLLHY